MILLPDSIFVLNQGAIDVNTRYKSNSNLSLRLIHSLLVCLGNAFLKLAIAFQRGQLIVLRTNLLGEIECLSRQVNPALESLGFGDGLLRRPREKSIDGL